MTIFATPMERREFQNSVRGLSIEDLKALNKKLLDECGGNEDVARRRETYSAIVFIAILINDCTWDEPYFSFTAYNEQKEQIKAERRALSMAEGEE